MKDLKAPGLCGLIYDDVLNKAFRPIPEISALMSLALVSAVMSREVLTPGGYHTNIHAVGIAPAAAGKDIIVQYFDMEVRSHCCDVVACYFGRKYEQAIRKSGGKGVIVTGKPVLS